MARDGLLCRLRRTMCRFRFLLADVGVRRRSPGGAGHRHPVTTDGAGRHRPVGSRPACVMIPLRTHGNLLAAVSLVADRVVCTPRPPLSGGKRIAAALHRWGHRVRFAFLR
ncbi:hypothetical protein GCM10014715_79910 [Streptomyces spiralis]|uniref:Uncharacterized protein n=1 Tax=Streptomyces spiralis TaxID=66376 RepID=A0A919AKU0_9ACTN|nr:hypothetical protein GCM10014715_79910 [Streptomyces spiralis]